MRSLAGALSLSLIMFLACVASEQKTDQPPPASVDTSAPATEKQEERSDATTTETSRTAAITKDREPETSDDSGRQADHRDVSRRTGVRPRATGETGLHRSDERATAPLSSLPATSVTDTAQPLRMAETRTVHFDAPAVPRERIDWMSVPHVTAELSPRAYDDDLPATMMLLASIAAQPSTLPLRQCVSIPINADPKIKRMNLALGANVKEYEGMPRNWTDPNWRRIFGIGADNKFHVNLWRVRLGTPRYIAKLGVSGGPGPTFEQFVLDAKVWREGDVACIEAAEQGGPLMIGYVFDDRARGIHYPRISIIEPTSNDPTAPFGQWMRFNGEVPR